MRKDSAIDCLSCILLRSFGPLIRSLPKSFTLFLGESLGALFYCLDRKHRAIAYSNIKTALGAQLPPGRIRSLTMEFYRAFGRNLVEIFFIPLVNEEYLKKYIRFEGLERVSEGFKKGKGVIFLGMHEGSWELSNIISALLGFPFSLFIRSQRLPRLNTLLNSYRSRKGCRIIQRKNETRQLIKELRSNSAIGMTADQGGKGGLLVDFFGKDASMPTGAVRIGLKYGAAIIPVFYTRIKGPYIKVFIEPPFELKRTGDPARDLRENLQEIIHIFERYIRRFPKEYLWSYKIWKYAKEKRILILSDAKAGHLRQAESVAKLASAALKDKGIKSAIDTLEVKFRNGFSRRALPFCAYFADRFSCQGCLWCLKAFLEAGAYKNLAGVKPDIIISCGARLAAVNLVLARESLARSIAVMRPSILSVQRFDLAVIPEHDRPPKRKNVAITQGALNLIDEDYLKEQSGRLIRNSTLSIGPDSPLRMGLLIGGDTKGFHLDRSLMSRVIKQIKSVCGKWNAHILVTTSRRTPKEIETLVKEEFGGYPRCNLLVIANEANVPEAVGGILALSSVVVTTPESISMISEAASSNGYAVTFKARGLSRRRREFLGRLNEKRHIYLSEERSLAQAIDALWLKRPAVNSLKDNILVRKALERIL